MIQEYQKYTENDHNVWKALYSRQTGQIQQYAAQAYLLGIQNCGFVEDHIPEIEKVNRRLLTFTGWQIEIVPGLIDNRSFFELLGQKRFPACTWLRKMEQLDYLEEPDMFHDVLGHVPLLTNPDFCNFLQDMALVASGYIDNAEIIEAISRLYWYTVEFGLIQEKGNLKIYGAGILSSFGETPYALHSGIPERVDYDVAEIIKTPYIKDRFQKKYFIIQSYRQLFKSLQELDCLLKIVI